MSPELLQMANDYEAPKKVADEMKSIRTTLLTGAAASGKDTIEQHIERLAPDDFTRFITSTTRAPRMENNVMEQHGVNYLFVSPDEAHQMLINGDYVEAAPVHGDRVNGSLVVEFRRIHGLAKIALGDVDYQGAEKYLKLGMDHLSIFFIVPPSFEVWLARWMKREGGSFINIDDTIKRFGSAQKELAHAKGNSNFIPVINDDSEATARRIIDIVKTGVRPSVEERQSADAIIESISGSIDEYVDQLRAS
jgi:guanylate kinase